MGHPSKVAGLCPNTPLRFGCWQETGSTAVDHGKTGWGGRIRTCECRHQKPVPYRLATPQCARYRAHAKAPI